MQQPDPQGASGAPASGDGNLRQLTPLLVWAVVFSDIGTSVYYVPGILHAQVGDGAPLYVLISMVAFLFLAAKYVEVCWRYPDGGGVVSVASHAFSARWGLVGGLLIIIDYFLTAAISSVSGIQYIASVLPGVGQHVMTMAWVVMVLLALINIIGIRESAMIAMGMAVLALVVDVAVIAVVTLRVGLPEWTLMGDLLQQAAQADGRTLLIGFSGAWLAFSGLESISQVTPAMRLPIRATARRGMLLVVASIVVIAPLLTLFSVALLAPETKAAEHERFISELAGLWGGLPLKIAVVASASALLLFAANTAIIGTYHVFVSLADKGFMPGVIAVRNARFGTPHVAILTATCIPLLVVMATGADLVALGDLYAFGLLGAFLLTSLGIDVIRTRERVRGARFWIGVATTLAVGLAWSVNLVAKQEATLFGVLALGIGLALALATHQRVFSNLFYEQPMVTRVTQRKILESERGLEQAERATILSLSQAQALTKLYPSKTLIALRGPSPEIIREAVAREKGRGGNALYAIYVEERTGLFVRSVDFDSPRGNVQAIEALDAAARQAELAGVTLLPIWTVSYNAVEGIVRAALALEVDAVIVGVSQRTAIYHLLRGHIVAGLSKRLPAHIRMLLYS